MQVRYLLSRGAVCSAGTFDGERCVYGALTDTIRTTLREQKVDLAALRSLISHHSPSSSCVC